MVKLQVALTLKRIATMKSWRRRIRCRRSKPDPIDSPPVKTFFLAEEEEEEVEDQVEMGEGDFCMNWGPAISFHIEYEKKIAKLEEQLKEAKADTDFWYLKAEELESHLQNQRLQYEMAQNAIEASDDDVTSQCSCTGLSGSYYDKL